MSATIEHRPWAPPAGERTNGQGPGASGADESDEDRPMGAYMAFMGLYAVAFGGALFLARKQNRPLPEQVNTGDLLLMGVATHKLSRMLTVDKITRPLRAPFTESHGSAGAGELDDEPRGTGLQKAVGELITCPFCAGAWVAAGFTYGMLFAPGATRVAGSILAAKAISDGLNLAYTAAKKGTEKLSDE